MKNGVGGTDTRMGLEKRALATGNSSLATLTSICAVLGLDPLAHGLQFYPAQDFVTDDSPFSAPVVLDPTRPLLVSCLQGRPMVAAVQRALQAHYPDDYLLMAVWFPVDADEAQTWQGALHDLPAWKEQPVALFLPPLPRSAALREAATLEWVCARLRGPGGCPWDQEQDHASLRNNLLEETYETLEALDSGDLDKLCEELGDLVMQVYLHAQLAREERAFTMADVVAGITAKLIRRHPHVFGTVDVDGSDEVLRNWEAIKSEERAERGAQDSLLASVPQILPALAYAQAVGRRVARVGFDWERVEEVWSKVEEELAELRQAATPEERAEELGDLLFALVNLARWFEVDAEDALRATNAKFRQRFAHIEGEAHRRGIALQDMGITEMDALWEAAKGLKH